MSSTAAENPVAGEVTRNIGAGASAMRDPDTLARASSAYSKTRFEANPRLGNSHSRKPAQNQNLLRSIRIERKVALAAIGLSGFVALGTEIAWSRLLVIHQGASIYAFSSMLIVMLACMSIGSLAAGWRLAKSADPFVLPRPRQLLVGLSLLGRFVALWPARRRAFFVFLNNSES